METPAIKLKYKDLSRMNQMLVQKLTNTPLHPQKANHIRKVMNEVFRVKEVMREDYKKISEKFGERDLETKAVIVIENDPTGIGFKVPEAEQKNFEDAIKDFDNIECEVKWRPLTPDTLSDIKLSAVELEILGPLYSDENGPGLPGLTAVR